MSSVVVNGADDSCVAIEAGQDGTDRRFTKSSGQTAVGPEAWFTGTVYIDSIRNPDEQSGVGCAHVRFSPGARTAWHTHPRGQTLYVTDGIGYVGRRRQRPNGHLG